MKPRKPIQRKTPLKRGLPPQRKTPLRSTGPGLQRKSGLHPVRQRKRTIKFKPARNFPHMGRVKALGCIVCRNLSRGHVDCHVHHLKRDPITGEHYGLGQRAPDEFTIGLCPSHHQEGPDAFHTNTREFQVRFGTEAELWNQTEGLLQDEDFLTSLSNAG